MAELKRLFSSLENAELAYRAQIDEDSSVLNQLHALSVHSHIVKHKYLTTMKDTFAANLARYRDEDLRVRSANLIKEKTVQIKWPLINNNNEKQTENLQYLHELKHFDSENLLPSPLIINNNQAHLFDNFDLIKQRYSSLADFNLSRDGKQLRITFKPNDIFVVFEAISNGRYGDNWKIIDSMPSLPSFTQLNTIIRQSNNLTCEHLCLIRACLLKQKKLNE